MTPKQTKIDTLSEDVAFIENLKAESLTALALYNLICQLYVEEGDAGMSHLEIMWRVAKADMQKNTMN